MTRHIPSRTALRAIVLALTAAQLTGCGGSDGTTQPPPPTTATGSLAIAMTGLPGDVTPSVTVTGPAGYTQTVTAPRTLTDLAVGTYTITAARVADRSVGYAAPVATATVSGGGTASATAGYALRILSRTSTNRTDESTAARVKLLYAVPSDGTDRGLDTTGAIHRTISSGQRWLATQTAGRSMRYDVSDGGLDITFVRLPRTDAVYLGYGAFIRDSMEKDLKAAGWTQANVLLLTYYDGRHVDRCASAAQPPLLPGTLGAVYLNGLPNASNGCATQPFAANPTAAPGYIDFVAVHELFHLLGLVSSAAPNHALQGHVGNDPTDLMYAGPLVWRPATVDVTKTNYYNATGLPSAVNNFINSPYVVPAP